MVWYKKLDVVTPINCGLCDWENSMEIYDREETDDLGIENPFKEKRKKDYQFYFLILIFLVVILFGLAIYVLLTEKDLIRKDPLVYGMSKHNFVECTCYDVEGKDWYSNGSIFIHQSNPLDNLNQFNLD